MLEFSLGGIYTHHFFFWGIHAQVMESFHSLRGLPRFSGRKGGLPLNIWQPHSPTHLYVGCNFEEKQPAAPLNFSTWRTIKWKTSCTIKEWKWRLHLGVTKHIQFGDIATVRPPIWKGKWVYLFFSFWFLFCLLVY